MSEEEVPTAPWYIWLGLSAIAATSFWFQATITEERFVPALNVIADYFNIPDDIAGATLMAAGASSPELFSSFVALFITHSSLGLGTIVGSEVFNQLIICAGAVYASQTGTLELDLAIVIREVGFYALSIVLLYFALQDHRPLEGDDSGVDHIFISFGEACYVFGGYILYVIVCANMNDIVAFCSRQKQAFTGGDERTQMKANYGAIAGSNVVDIDVPEDMKFVADKKVLKSVPGENAVEYFPADSERGDGSGVPSEASVSKESFLSKSIRSSMQALGAEALKAFQYSEKPSQCHSIHELQINEFAETVDCFLWQKSFFYTKAKFGKMLWHLRWFSISPDRVVSVPDKHDSEKRRMKYPVFKEIEIDDKKLLIKIINPTPGKRDFTLMAPSRAIFEAVVKRFEANIELHAADAPGLVDQIPSALSQEFEDAGPHTDLIEFPASGSNVEIIFFIILAPLRYAMHYTTPDVRKLDSSGNPTGKLSTAFFVVFMCLVWLVIGSYAMVASLEHLAALMDIPDSVIGVTVSAAGTSLPNYVASKVAAERGLGNQAVSNAFGSNTFNIMVGLGLPWVLYTSFGTGFEPYSGLRDEGISESIIILGSVLLVFIVLMIPSGFVVKVWHGHLFVFLYIAYIAYSVGQVYL